MVMLAAKVKIKLNAAEVTKERIAEIKNICRYHKGRSPLCMAIDTGTGQIYATADKNLSVNPDVDFCRKMRQLVGEDNFQLAR